MRLWRPESDPGETARGAENSKGWSDLMSGIEDRVKEFLGSWRHVANLEIAVCCCCGAELIDGNFAVIDGKLRCLDCYKKSV
jgi:hypothetical protein